MNRIDVPSGLYVITAPIDLRKLSNEEARQSIISGRQIEAPRP